MLAAKHQLILICCLLNIQLLYFHLVSGVEADKTIKCKYVLVEKNYYNKLQQQQQHDLNSSWLFQKHFNFGISGRVELLKSHLFKWHVEDCLNANILDRIDVENNLFRFNSDIAKFSLFGVDMSANDLSDVELESVLTTNPIFRYNLNLIRYLNLANNQLSRLISNLSRSSEELDELKLLNDETVSSFLRPNQTGYLLSRFFNLESVLLDDNPQLAVSVGDLTSVMPKLRVLSAARCGAASQSQIQTGVEPRSLVYLGLSGNRMGDTALVHYLPGHLTNIDTLDLSFNKISNVSNVLARLDRTNRLNLEKNLIESVRVEELSAKSIAEVNLRSNFIQNTSVANFRLHQQLQPDSRPVGIRLAGNPLICDCGSMWLLDLLSQQQQQQQQAVSSSRSTQQLLNRKRPRTAGKDVKIVSRRDMEVISYHNIDQDPNFSKFMQRQKRLNGSSMSSTLGGLAKFLDLDQLTCSFIDTQDTGSPKRLVQPFLRVDRPLQISNDYDMSSSFDYYLVDLVGSTALSTWEIKQKLHVVSIRYREKLLSQSSQQDFMCQYKDHCQADQDCDCCVFQHCHCRSICPSKCRCYFDSTLAQSIIDCSQSNLIDVPSEYPIESATDMRLNANNLKMLKAFSFFGYGSLKYLYLQDNQISALSRNTFDDLRSTLRLLNLANNRLDYLHGDEFKGYTELEIIVLTSNPIRQIDSLDFLSGVDSLPKLKFIYAAKTQLSGEQTSKVVAFVKANSNATFKYKDRRLTQTQNSTLLAKIGKASNEYSMPNGTVKQRPDESILKSMLNETSDVIRPPSISHGSPIFLLPLNGLTRNIYFITISIIAACLLFSLSILAFVLCIVKRIENGRRGRSRAMRASKVSAKKAPASYFAAPVAADRSCNSSDSSSDDEGQSLSSTSSRGRRLGTCLCRRSSSLDSAASSSYFDSTASSNATNHTAATDAASVPVSRSLEHTCLCVYVYYSIADSHYANEYLLPCLRKCLTIVPDTRFIMRAERDKYAWAGDDSMMSNKSGQPGESSALSSNATTMRGAAGTTTTAASSNNRHLIARIVVMSENFYGLCLNAENCLTASSSSDRSLVTFKLSNRTTNSRHELFKIHLFNVNTGGTLGGNGGGQKHMTEMVATTTATSSRLNSFNKGLIRRLFESGSPTTTTMSPLDQQRVSRFSNLATTSSSSHNDLFSSFAFSEHLQSKLEKFLGHVCLKKSHSFSKTTNFSYVDYTKR